MRYIILFWALPLGTFWGWYFLSLNDINFGLLFFSRDVHDLAFQIYGNMLGIDPQTIPGLVARACLLDSVLIVALFAFRRRRQIREWVGTRYLGEAASPPSDLSRSSTP